MFVELENEIYETKLQHVQIEITGCCNMKCKHCRASNEAKKMLTMSQIEKIIKFITKVKDDDFRLILSGGEPFLHPQIIEIIKLAKEYGIDSIVITTNSSLITDDILNKLDDIKMKFLCIQVSLDSLNEKQHNEFRGFPNAYQKCLDVLDKIQNYDNIYSSIRMTITPSTINEIDKMIDFAIRKKVKIIGIGSVIPFGNAKDGSMSLTPLQKKEFLTILAKKHIELEEIVDVTSEDPLKFLIPDSPWNYCNGKTEFDDCFFGGCTAGVTSINISADGTVTPCAMMEEKIFNIDNCNNIDEMIFAYCNSNIIKNLFTRKFNGKCGKCKFNRTCGGCRAFAKASTDDYMGSDLSCWYND